MALNRARPRENRKNENDFDKPVKKKLEACTGKKFTNSIEIKSNHEDKKIVFKEIDVFILSLLPRPCPIESQMLGDLCPIQILFLFRN